MKQLVPNRSRCVSPAEGRTSDPVMPVKNSSSEIHPTEQSSRIDSNPNSSHDPCHWDSIQDNSLARYVSNISREVGSETKSAEQNSTKQDAVKKSQSDKSIIQEIEGDFGEGNGQVLLVGSTLQNDCVDENTSAESLKLSMDETKQVESDSVLGQNEKCQHNFVSSQTSMDIQDSQQIEQPEMSSAATTKPNILQSQQESDDISNSYGFVLVPPQQREPIQRSQDKDSICHESVIGHSPVAKNNQTPRTGLSSKTTSAQVGLSLLMHSLDLDDTLQGDSLDVNLRKDDGKRQQENNSHNSLDSECSQPKTLDHVFEHWTCQSEDHENLNASDKVDNLDHSLILPVSCQDYISATPTAILTSTMKNSSVLELDSALKSPGQHTEQYHIPSEQIDGDCLENIPKLTPPFLHLSPIMSDSKGTSPADKEIKTSSQDLLQDAQAIGQNAEDCILNVGTLSEDYELIDQNVSHLSKVDANISEPFNYNSSSPVNNFRIVSPRCLSDDVDGVHSIISTENHISICNGQEEQRVQELAVTGTSNISYLIENEGEKEKSQSNLDYDGQQEGKKGQKQNLLHDVVGSVDDNVDMKRQTKKTPEQRVMSHGKKKSTRKRLVAKNNGKGMKTSDLYKTFPKMPGWCEGTTKEINAAFPVIKGHKSSDTMNESKYRRKRRLYNTNTVLCHDSPETREETANKSCNYIVNISGTHFNVGTKAQTLPAISVHPCPTMDSLGGNSSEEVTINQKQSPSPCNVSSSLFRSHSTTSSLLHPRDQAASDSQGGGPGRSTSDSKKRSSCSPVVDLKVCLQ